MKHYLIELLKSYKKENNYTWEVLGQLAETHPTNLRNCACGRLSITKTILDRLNIKPSKTRLRNEIITQIEQNNNIEQLIFIYNYLKRNN